jgi:hypothetical protein
MLDAKSVITTATKGFVEEIAKRREISETRMYEILGKDNPYPKAKILIRDIAQVNQAGARLIKADLMAMFAQILGPETELVTDAELHGELNDVVQARLRNAPKDMRLTEDRQAVDVLNRDIAELERETAVSVRVEMRQAVEQKRRNGSR